MSKTRTITLADLPPAFEVKPHKVNEIMQYGADNNYPTRMERIIDASITARSAANMYARFLKGDGFEDESLNDVVVGVDEFSKNVTARKLLSQIAGSISKFNGFYVRAQFNANLVTTSFKHVPFKYCRFSPVDSEGRISDVVIYDDWDRYKSGNKFAKQNKEKFIHVGIWNPKILDKMVESAGSIKNFKGQMYFQFIDEQYLYPSSPIEPVQFDADTESQISKFKNGELRRGFFLKYIIQHAPFENNRDKADFEEQIQKMMGGGHDISHLLIEGEFDEVEGNLKDNALIKVDKIEQNINDKLFSAYENSTLNNIRKAFNAIPQILIDYEDGKLGTTSGEALKQAAEFYNSQTDSERGVIEQSFKEMFANFKDQSLRDRDWTIKKLQFDGPTMDNNGSAGD